MNAWEMVDGVPRIPVGEWISDGFDWVEDNLGDFFDLCADGIESVVGSLGRCSTRPRRW